MISILFPWVLSAWYLVPGIRVWMLITGTDADTDIHTDEKKRGEWNEKEKENKEKGVHHIMH